MDLSMADKDFLKTVVDMLDSRLSRVESKIDSNNQIMTHRVDRIETKLDQNTVETSRILEQARYTNGRVTASEKAIKKLESRKGRKLDLPPNVIYILAVGGVILLIIIASLLGLDVRGIVK